MVTQERIIELLGNEYTDQSLIRQLVSRELEDLLDCVKEEIEECNKAEFDVDKYKACSERVDVLLKTIDTEREMLRNPDGNNCRFFRKLVSDSCDRARTMAYNKYLKENNKEAL